MENRTMEAISVAKNDIIKEVAQKKAQGCRLVTLSGVELDEKTCDLLYHFDQDLELSTLRLTVARDEPVPSISGVYFAAFLVENEIQDQFGLRFDGLALDYDRTLYLDEEVATLPFCKYSVSANSGKK